MIEIWNYLKQKIDETKKCHYDFSCLWDETNHLCGNCKIEWSATSNVLFLKEKSPVNCPYKLTWGFGEICRCPTKQALYELYSEVRNRDMDTGVWIADEKDIIISANTLMERILDIPIESIVGTNVLTGVTLDTIRFLKPYYRKAKKTGESQRYDHIPVVTPAGRPIRQSGWLIPQLIGSKKFRTICTVEDVTEPRIYEPSLE
jgi:hypothetical protein